jgi:peroxiredoxin
VIRRPASAILIVLLAFIACNSKPAEEVMTAKANTAVSDTGPLPIVRYAIDSILIVDPIVAPNQILSSFNNFWAYYTQEVKLYEDFHSYDFKGKLISKGEFLMQMTTGLYFPLLLYSLETPVYKLEKIPKKANPFISAYMKQFSTEELTFYGMQGKPMPDFRFEDIDGNVFTPKNTLGKIVLVKCWFIGCVACMNEMPELNKMVKAYKGRSDIVFISIAPDSKSAVKNFFSSRHFEYKNAFGQSDYLQRMKISSYPTHFLIGKDGKVFRVVKDQAALSASLEKYLSE